MVPQIHCSGCANLIKLTLEDDFPSVAVDQESKIVSFESDKEIIEAQKILAELFAELKDEGYSYENLTLI